MKRQNDHRCRLRLLVLAACGLLVASCSQVGDTIFYGREAAAAKDQIMLVRQEPPSFGYQRLSTQTRNYPDLGFFVSKRGVPNFFAETGNQNRKYFILYYLSDREAFACRTSARSRNAVEFAGPYPITDREFKLLDGFRKDPSRRPGKF